MVRNDLKNCFFFFFNRNTGLFLILAKLSHSAVRNQFHIIFYPSNQADKEAETVTSPVITAKRDETVVKQKLALRTSAWN
jgi:hypothetical protein